MHTNYYVYLFHPLDQNVNYIPNTYVSLDYCIVQYH